MKRIIHINRFTIDRNRKTCGTDPPIIVRTYKGTTHAKKVVIKGPCQIVYSPHKPLAGCGARVWIETTSDIECV